MSALPIAEPEFDPLVEFAGVWNTRLAERFLPIPELPGAKYECVDGRLIMTPTEGVPNVYAESKLIRLIGPAADAAGLHIMSSVNLAFNEERWIQPDVTVLHTLPRNAYENIWVPPELFAMVAEFVSPSGRSRDRIDKPAICAAAGIPYFLRVEIVQQLRSVTVKLLKLVEGRYELLTAAMNGQIFEAKEPFAIRFAPEDLLY